MKFEFCFTTGVDGMPFRPTSKKYLLACLCQFALVYAVTVGAFLILQRTAQFTGMHERESRHIHTFSCFWCFLQNNGMAVLALVVDDLTCGSFMLAIVAAETAVIIQMPDVVGVVLPVSFHFREIIPPI